MVQCLVSEALGPALVKLDIARQLYPPPPPLYITSLLTLVLLWPASTCWCSSLNVMIDLVKQLLKNHN